METFLSRLECSFAAHRDRPAVIFEHRQYLYGDLASAVSRVASFLRRRGVQPGDRVLLFAEAKEPFLLGYLGSIWCGAVPLPVNPASKPAELRYFQRDSSAAAIVYDPPALDTLAELDQQSGSCCQISGDELLHASSAGSEFPPPYDATFTDPALLLYSSGTTGEPKGVVHNQANLLCSVQAIVDTWQLSPNDVVANVLPLFHIHGLSFATNSALLAGCTMLVGNRFHPTQTWDLIDRSTVFMGVPPYYYSMLKRDEFRDRASRWSRLRLVTCGSAPIRAELLPELEGILNRPVINRYGMTECHVLTSLPLCGPWPHGSVGTALRGIEVCVRDSTGGAVESGVPGQVWARGPNLFERYWNRPGETAASFDADHWFDTGDVGQWDGRGFLTLVGRSKDLIIVGGFNVYPPVVERVVNECPGVRECAVVGIPDAERGERVAVFVVAHDHSLDAKRVRAFCLDRLSDYQCPTLVQFVADLPRNAMGKVLKRELRERRP